jgi:hypothetical protein
VPFFEHPVSRALSTEHILDQPAAAAGQGGSRHPASFTQAVPVGDCSLHFGAQAISNWFHVY